MTVHFVTGKLGGGKSLVAVARMVEDYLEKGKPVATNLDLFFQYYPPGYKSKKPYCIRIPDEPSSDDLKALGYGNESADETKNGLLVFDEIGTWFNSQDWNKPDRKEFRNVLIHLRKLGWDVIFLVQDIDMVDSQARKGICEFLVECSRTDRLNIPFISTLTKLLTGKPFPVPRVHIGRVWYMEGNKKTKSDVWRYRGTELFDFYDTKQIFSPEYEHGSYCYLKPANLHYDKTTIAAAKKDYQNRALKRLWHLRPPILFFLIIGFTAAFVFQGIFAAFKSQTSEKPDVQVVNSDHPLVDRAGTIPEIQLTGVVTIGKEYFFYFMRGDETYDPAIDGFAYMPVGKCGARLIKKDYDKIILCSRNEDDIAGI